MSQIYSENIKPLRMRSSRWKNTIQICPEEIGWMHLVQDREEWLAVINRLINLPVSRRGGNL